MAVAKRKEHDKGWQASLRLGFRVAGRRTVLAERQRCGPLGVQRAFYPEGPVCHVYLLHPPGGVVGGDGRSSPSSQWNPSLTITFTKADGEDALRGIPIGYGERQHFANA